MTGGGVPRQLFIGTGVIQGTDEESNTVKKERNSPVEEAPWEWIQGRLIGQGKDGISVHLIDGEEIPLPGAMDAASGKQIKLPATSLTSAGRVLLANDYPVDRRTGRINCPHDLIHLAHLHEPSVVECLRERFHQSQIYTRTGPVLIALNPFETLPHLYSRKTMELYWDRAEFGQSYHTGEDGPANDADNNADLPPHVFEIADGAFRQMQRSLDAQIQIENPIGCHQSILVSGESGSGKTVTTKVVMKYLASLSERLAALRTNPNYQRAKTNRRSECQNNIAISGRFSVTSKKVVAQPVWSMGSPSAATGDYPVSPSPKKSASSPKRIGRTLSIGRGITDSPQASQAKSPALSPLPRSRSRSATRSKPGDMDLFHTNTVSSGIESKVLQSNPILESFGNARTVRNDNSSRFGKYIEIQFSRLAKLEGALIETYLLEKVRLVKQNPGERNYHIFYELLSGGVDTEELAALYLEETSKPTDFKITASGTYDRRDKVSDKDTFIELRQAMSSIGFSQKQQQNIFAIVAALLHGSNLCFHADESDAAHLMVDNPHLDKFCHLMGFSSHDLEMALCTSKIVIDKKTFEKRLTVVNAEKGLDALLKSCYGALFTYLVTRINDSIACRDVSDSISRPVANIGVLDIFGFESFQTNLFEQLCINFCNETLQQQFNSFVLQNEQAEYQREGIDWSFIEFPDNQDILELIDKRGKGILNILDDHCRSPKPKDSAYAYDVYKICCSHARFNANEKHKFSQQFVVQHYAGPVEYTIDGFTEKNCDDLPNEANDILLGSSSSLIKELARIIEHGHDLPTALDSVQESSSPARLPGDSSTNQRGTVSEQFRRQLRNLRMKVDRTSPHYIRCLKPNSTLESGVFQSGSVAEQLRCGGILEAVRVSRAGFAQHYQHADFISRYAGLAGIKQPRTIVPDESRKLCEKIIDRLKRNGYLGINQTEKTALEKHLQMGKTKIFLTKAAFMALEQSHGRRQDLAATKLNANFRRYLARTHYFVLLSEHRTDVAEKLRREALELEARESRKAKERELRLRKGLPLDDEKDEEFMNGLHIEQSKADFEFNKLLGFHKEVLTKVEMSVNVTKKPTGELKWVCENGQWIRREVVSEP